MMKVTEITIRTSFYGDKQSLIRSSTAEYLTLGESDVEVIYADENIWLTQKMIGMFYDVKILTVNYHINKIFSDSELEENSVIRNFRITAAEIAKVHAESEFQKYRIIQDRLFESDFDRVVKQIDENSSNNIKK